ncbi:hypothetical protein [Sphingomonas profundi]|uniref:hypothetical protein n=1 Tax=Alterirhizorhabdus profundi TaxID=2681549 RepID=UPI001E52F98C|nr:hypothetical protein [Sphingomonas profundi]
MEATFSDLSGYDAPGMHPWAPIVVRRADIERHIDDLAAAAAPDRGIRAVRMVHPQSPPNVHALAPTIACELHVLLPGETTAPMRHNAAEVSLCLRGRGQVTIGREIIRFVRNDVWNAPAMHYFSYRNADTELTAWLTFSNAALLETMGIHYVEHAAAPAVPHTEALEAGSETAASPERKLPPPIFLENGTQMLTYEHLVAPEIVENQAHHWRWDDIVPFAHEMFDGDKNRNFGRRGIFALYNPATGRLKGATHSFFAAWGYLPGDVIDFPHRHTSSAIVYCMEGDQISEVDGQRLYWGAGDIAYTAPNWAAHANGSQRGSVSFIVQDHPLQIGLEALLWQEGDDKPIRLLGGEQGFVPDDSVVLGGAG